MNRRSFLSALGLAPLAGAGIPLSAKASTDSATRMTYLSARADPGAVCHIGDVSSTVISGDRLITGSVYGVRGEIDGQSGGFKVSATPNPDGSIAFTTTFADGRSLTETIRK